MKVTILFFCISLTLITACKKENGKHQYELRYLFTSGDYLSESGKIYEVYKKNKKYQEKIKPASKSLQMGERLFLELYKNQLVALKLEGDKIIISGSWSFATQTPYIFANNQHGGILGEIYMEGSYTQKGRAYTVENGDFEFYWRNAEDFGMTDTILKGTWTLKRK